MHPSCIMDLPILSNKLKTQCSCLVNVQFPFPPYKNVTIVISLILARVGLSNEELRVLDYTLSVETELVATEKEGGVVLYAAAG